MLLAVIPEVLDDTLSTLLTIGSAGLGWWAHLHHLGKERKRVAKEAMERYAESEKKAYAAERDFGHIKRDIEQLKLNITQLNEESDERLDKLERQMDRISGSIEVLKELMRSHD